MLIIGELINATRKRVREAILEKNDVFLQELACRQADAGADCIDVNVATGSSKQPKEVEDMGWAVTRLKATCNKPLAIDTTDPEVLEAGLRAHGPGALVNSVSAEQGSLQPFLELALKYECTVIALPVQDSGIPKDVKTRIEVAGRILAVAEQVGFPVHKLFFDPLVIPLGVGDENAWTTLETLRRFKEELKVNTVLGLTNISHGLPERTLLNRTFLVMAMDRGLDAAIVNPLDKKVMSSLLSAAALRGNDPYCGNYIKAFRQGLLVP